LYNNVFQDVISEGGKSSKVLKTNNSTDNKSLKLMINDLEIFKAEGDV
jgi:hypothetical protein